MSDIKIQNSKAKDLISEVFKYDFINIDLLVQAITHKSISKKNYERLEFLGDAVLQLIITKYLYNKYPDNPEGDLSREKQSIVSKKIMSMISSDMNLLSILRSNNLKVDSNPAMMASLSTDVMESIIGAIFLDSNYSTCETIVIDVFNKYLNGNIKIGKKDPKTLLQEHMQSIGKSLPIYTTIKINGPSHDPEFKIKCSIDIFESPEYVISKTVQSGQQNVSQKFLDKINDEKKI